MRYSKLNKRLIGMALVVPLALGCSGTDDLESDFSDGLTQIVPNDFNIAVQLGQGRNFSTEEWKRQCLNVPTPINSSHLNIGDAYYRYSMSQNEFEDNLEIDVSAKASLKLFSGDYHSNFKRWTKSTSKSINLIYRSWSITNTQILPESALQWNVLPNDPNFYSYCGDLFVRQIKEGGKIFIVISIDFASSAAKTEFEAKLAAQGSVGILNVDANVAIEKISRALTSESLVSVRVYQVGGNPGALSIALGKDATSCNADQMSTCTSFMQNAISFAQNEYVAQLDAKPAAIDFVLQDWALLGVGTPLGEIPAAVTNARNSLVPKFDLQAKVQNRAVVLAAAKYWGASASFVNKVRDYFADSQNNVRFLGEAVKACYDNLNSPNGQAACITAASDTTLREKGYKDLTNALNEILEVPVATENIALGKATSQSSTAWDGLSFRAVDGYADGYYQNNSTTHTNYDNAAWWKVDFGAAHSVQKVILFNRQDGYSERLSNFHVDLLDQYGNLISRKNIPGVANYQEEIPIFGLGVYSVRVQLYGQDFLSLAEVRVLGFGGPSSPRNIALGKTTDQSSTGWGGASSRAVDENLNGYWQNNSTTHTENNAAAWWKVDLGAAHTVQKVTLFNRQDAYAERLANFHVDLLDQYGNVIAKKDYPGQAAYQTDFQFQATGVYSVRVQLYGRDYLSLAEVMVFGSRI